MTTDSLTRHVEMCRNRARTLLPELAPPTLDPIPTDTPPLTITSGTRYDNASNVEAHLLDAHALGFMMRVSYIDLAAAHAEQHTEGRLVFPHTHREAS